MTLTTDGGYTADWSNGASGSSIDVEEAGTYTVTLTDEAGCSFTSEPVVIDVLETVAPDSDLVTVSLGSAKADLFCSLAPMEAHGIGTWAWKTRALKCPPRAPSSSTFTDAAATRPPWERRLKCRCTPSRSALTEDFTIVDPADVALNATGDNLLWYEPEGDIVPFGAGPDVTTYTWRPTTTFWVESESANDGTDGHRRQG